MASAAVYPNNSSAPRFQDVMMPFRSLLTIASSDDSTIAASRSVGSGGRMVIGSERRALPIERLQRSRLIVHRFRAARNTSKARPQPRANDQRPQLAVN